MTASTADDVYLGHREALFGLAYRMLGSVADAEDVVAETYVRWRRVELGTIDNPRAFLFTVASRLSLDLLKSAARSRVDYVGTWLPEPIVTPYDDQPAAAVETRDTLSIGFLMLLEQLSPLERAVFVLREAFDYPYAEIAELLDVSTDSVRQLSHRARRRLGAGAEPRFVPDPRKGRELVDRFLAATTSGEIDPLARLLADDAILYADGGGKVSSVRAPARGGLRVARFIRGLARKAPAAMTVDIVRANNDPALLFRDGVDVIGVYVLDLDARTDLVRAIYAVRNPDKLRRLPA